MAAPIQKVSCPICGKDFVLSTINQHIDSCLTGREDCESNTDSNKSESHDCQPMNKRKRTENTFFPIKKQENYNYENEKDSNVERLSGAVQSSMSAIRNTGSSKSATGSGASFFAKHTKSQSHKPTDNDDKQKADTMESATMQELKGPLHSNAKPLAEIMRPQNLEEYIGQLNVVGANKQLHQLLSTGEYMSLIFWGPPGCGKTTLAKIIATKAKLDGFRFVTMSATTSGVADIKEVTKAAKNDLKMFKRRTILFVDEIHHFNKTQQDTFLPFVEDGTLILLGATTENPSFQLNNALLSRCRVVVLDKLVPQSIRRIIERALEHLKVTIVKNEEDGAQARDDKDGKFSCRITDSAVEQISLLCDGDARAALNCLEVALRAVKDVRLVTAKDVMEALQRNHVNYDRAGEEHYNCASALQKSIRGSSDQGALYWVARMMEGGEEPLYIARRLVRTASEDIGLADPMALTHAMAAFHACQALGKKECDVILAQCAVYLARAPKSTEVYSAYNAAVSSIRQHQGPLPGVPLHLRNASTKLMKELGYGKGYRYAAKPGEQTYLPDGLQNTDFFKQHTT